MNKFNELEILVASMKNDMNKIFNKSDKSNKAAAVRVRKQMQTIKELAQEIRNEIQLVVKK